MTAPLWHPSTERIERSNLTAFMAAVREQWGTECSSYDELYRWSLAQPEHFWQSMWSFGGVIAAEQGEVIVRDRERMPGARWFPQARLNFAENLLRGRGSGAAIVFRGEDRIARTLSYDQLNTLVSRLSQALREAGVSAGDRVGGFLPNVPEAIAAMLATASLGAVWSSCSPDFGVQGVLDRFGQIDPKVVFGADGYFYGGKVHDSLARLQEITAELPSVARTVVVPYVSSDPAVEGVKNAVLLDDFIEGFAPRSLEYEQCSFNDPLYIMFSSGTTGVPKCIVHGIGGTLLEHLKEHLLHCDVKPGERLFYFTTCGWMMWNWLASGLASGATLLLYDGSPFHPGPERLFDYVSEAGMTIFGTSAKYIDAVKKSGLEPIATHDLSSLHTMLSTGSPLVPESFDFVYEKIKADVCLSSISGGTDIMGCFVAGCPTLPVWRGEIQCRTLGLDVQILDEQGASLPPGKRGELACTASFPSMPLYFWNDPGGERYRAAYFDKIADVWCHGDYAELTEHDGVVIHGRSDAVLNPGGVRIGTAEIYRQAEQIPEVVESLVIAQRWQGDVRVVLFVRLRDGATLDDALVKRIKRRVRDNASPRHVPARVVQVADIPRTRSGKIVELAVRSVVHGEPVKNVEALANPEALELFRDRPELAT